jgi:hypothetical protein
MTANVSPEQIATARPIAPLSKPSKYSEEFRLAIAEEYRGGASLAGVGIKFNLTKGQVAGMLSRAGVFVERPRRGPTVPKKAKPARTHNFVVPKFRRDPFKERVAPVAPLNIPFLQRKLDQCAWIEAVTDPAAQTCCGHPTYGTTSWCEGHAQIVFQSRPR